MWCGSITCWPPFCPGLQAVRPRQRATKTYPRDPSLLSKITTEDVWERGTCFGSPERVIGQMKRYMHEAEATSFLHQMRIGGLEHKKVMRSMELFAQDVMPALREEEAKMGVTILA